MGSLLSFKPRSAGSADFAPSEVELALIERARSGDVTAWAELYHQHFGRILKYVAYLVGDAHAAEDLVQETFARAWQGLARFEPYTPFVGWLRGISLNVVRKHWRSRQRGDLAMARLALMRQSEPAGGLDPESAHLQQRRAEVLLAVLETLPESLREAFVLCDMHEMSTVAAAAEVGVSPGNLRVRATRARAKIRSELVRLGWLTEAGVRQRKEDDDDSG